MKLTKYFPAYKDVSTKITIYDQLDNVAEPF